MARDERIKMRNGFVIPGGLLAFYSLVGIVYAESFRAKSDFCPDSNLILINDVCYTVWKLLTPLLLVGIGLLVAGLWVFRGEPEDLEGHLHHGTGSHFTLAWLISLVVMPAIGWIIQTVRESQGSGPFVLEFQEVQYEHTFVLELVILLGILMLAPYLGAYIMTGIRRRTFLAAAEAALEEPEPLPHEEGFEHGDAMPEAEVEAEMDDGTEWPDDREGAVEGEEADGVEEDVEEDVEEYAEESHDDAEYEAPGDADEPDDDLDAEPSGAFIGCHARLETGETCPNPTGGARFCSDHACQGATVTGAPCRLQALDGRDYCSAHAS